MNNILKLKGTFTQKENLGHGGGPKLPKGAIVNVRKLEKLKQDINEIDLYWKGKQKYVNGIFFSAYYKDIVPKSRRIGRFFKCDSTDMSEKIVGAKFSNDKKSHIITYYVEQNSIQKTLEEINIVCQILNENFPDGISDVDFEKKDDKKIEDIVDFDKYNIKKTPFLQLIVDAHNVERFTVEENIKNYEEKTIITIYETEKELIDLLKLLDISINQSNILSNDTVLLDKDSLEKLNKDASYLISMALEDISKMPIEEKKENEKTWIGRFIKDPTNEPTIGVIDKPFRNGVYFSKWVSSKNVGIPEEAIVDYDYNHGTGVSSIIVDGSGLNPNRDDGCGNFKVRHFGVAVGPQFSSFRIIKSIEKIIEENRDIKVWNLSLGSDKEISDNFISPEAAFLDELQIKHDVVFVIAGTNMPREFTGKNMKIGAPADSINSVVVNAVDKYNNPTSYTREGEVLSFYIKPDVSYFGGDLGREADEFINVCDGINVEHLAKGTSYSAPWIARKLAYLIYILGFSKEEAKALIIDSCEDWSEQNKNNRLIGHGVVPTHIDKIIKSSDDEIKFVISGTSEKYDTYNYKLPIPLDKGKYPFVVKATMCYFPKCTRSQGVDYTNTEFELKLGRLKFNPKTNEYIIIGINNDVQDVEGEYTTEEEARKDFRKWDNTKCIKEKFNSRVRDKIMYDNPLWGISVKTKNRINQEDGKNIKFGIVITLKEIHKKNRINEFIHQCSFHQWFVEEVNIENKINIYNISEEDIQIED
jgi:hypothetical protein